MTNTLLLAIIVGSVLVIAGLTAWGWFDRRRKLVDYRQQGSAFARSRRRHRRRH